MGRLRNLARAMLTYYRSWRGIMITASVVIAALIVLATGGASVPTVVAALIPLTAILVLAAHDSQRLGERIREAGGATGPAAHAPVVQGPAFPMQSAPDRYLATPPDVTVVVTAFNEARHLGVCLDSLRWQTHPNWEAVIVDDGSTDRTRQIALDYATLDIRFRVVAAERNSGLAAARNIGIAAARSDHITFLDGDDYLYPEALGLRLAAMPPPADEPWCAGVYCNWVSVSEDDEGRTEQPVLADRGPVTWFDALDDAPFIASAPVLRTAVLRAVGGFPSTLTAEDAGLWNTILRHGWSFRSTPYTGVAYRMKRVSMFREAPVLHTEIIESIAESNTRPMEPVTRSAPFAFTEPYAAYLPRRTRVRRLIGALASAIETGTDPGPVEAQLRAAFDAHHAWTINLDAVVTGAARRVTAYLGAASDLPFVKTREVLTQIVASLRTRAREDVVTRMRAHDEPAPPEVPRWRDCRPLAKSAVPPALLSSHASPVTGRLIILPTASYHMDEAGPLSESLLNRGVGSVVMASDRRWSEIRHALPGFGLEAIDAVEAGGWLAGSLGILTFNDWGEYGHDYVVEANRLGLPTVAKVEGVQDYTDADVHWDRKAYRWSSLVLAQGRNDATALAGQETVVVGSSRLERIWLDPPRPYRGDLAVINVNFTYHVLEDARDLWVHTATTACQRAGMPYVLSLHPAEGDRYADRHPVADQPMRHLLTQASVLISRFSTVPFEAMARGVPFVYHNPHGEKVPTFQDPGGAFDISDDVPSLVAALDESRRFVSTYRDRAAPFFLDQIDVDPATPPEERAADVIAGLLAGT